MASSSSSSSAQAQRNLTFGLELEFLCVRPTDLFAARNVRPHEQAGVAIYRAFQANRIPVTGYEDIDDEDDYDDNHPSHSRWRVESDELSLSDRERRHLPRGHVAESIELSSRVFNFYSTNWRNEISTVLRILRALEARGCRFITNKSTGLHVHVGRGSRRIDLRTAKNVLELCTAGEKCLDELHSVSRIGRPRDFSYRSNYYPLSFFHLYAEDADPNRPISLFRRLSNIEEIRNFEELGDFFSVLPPDNDDGVPTTGHNSTVNFDNLFPDEDMGRYEDNITGTIEFRQHSGSLDFPEIVAWTVLVCQIVEFATNAPMGRMVDLCIRAADPSFRLVDFLTYIQVPSQVRAHYTTGGNTIGVIPENAGRNPPLRSEFDALVEQNDHEAERNADRRAVQSVIREKLETGVYGINPNVRIHLPATSGNVLTEGLRNGVARVQAAGGDSRSERGESTVRSYVFQGFPYQFNIRR